MGSRALLPMAMKTLLGRQASHCPLRSMCPEVIQILLVHGDDCTWTPSLIDTNVSPSGPGIFTKRS